MIGYKFERGRRDCLRAELYQNTTLILVDGGEHLINYPSLEGHYELDFSFKH